METDSGLGLDLTGLDLDLDLEAKHGICIGVQGNCAANSKEVGSLVAEVDPLPGSSRAALEHNRRSSSRCLDGSCT
jgi:hypothetical protein